MISQNFKVIDHPLIKRDMTVLRCLTTNAEDFRGSLLRISRILAVEISRIFRVKEVEVDTPLEKTAGHLLATGVVLAPVLRAGLGMVNGFLDVIPDSKVGHIGLKRDEETLKPVYYYYKTPADLENSMIIVLDPMLATGGSASEALNYLKESGGKEIILACLVAAPEGVKRVTDEHPDVHIYSAALDRQLNSRGYILPGLGDAGDRIFGT
jgi:uracil phosphoribosyltransferase